MEQGTEGWLIERAGKVTASRFKDVMAKIKTGEAATRRNYRMQIVTERLTGLPTESYKNAAMEWGTANEPLAREVYEAVQGVKVEQHGLLNHLTVDAACSPDGIIGTDGGIEIKCPFNSMVHVETILSGMPSEHIAQVQGAMWITGRKWWDFVSFDPRLPENMRIYIQRIDRDDAYIDNLEVEIMKFLADISELEAKLTGGDRVFYLKEEA